MLSVFYSLKFLEIDFTDSAKYLELLTNYIVSRTSSVSSRSTAQFVILCCMKYHSTICHCCVVGRTT
jgi:hypothetical protein